MNRKRNIERLTCEELQDMEYKDLHTSLSKVDEERVRIYLEIEERKMKEKQKWYK